jgi:hypothetical protein
LNKPQNNHDDLNKPQNNHDELNKPQNNHDKTIMTLLRTPFLQTGINCLGNLVKNRHQKSARLGLETVLVEFSPHKDATTDAGT